MEFFDVHEIGWNTDKILGKTNKLIIKQEVATSNLKASKAITNWDESSCRIIKYSLINNWNINEIIIEKTLKFWKQIGSDQRIGSVNVTYIVNAAPDFGINPGVLFILDLFDQ